MSHERGIHRSESCEILIVLNCSCIVNLESFGSTFLLCGVLFTGGIPIPGGGSQHYQRSYSQGTPPSNSPGVHNGSPRVSPYVYLYPSFTAPNHLTSPVSFAFVCTNIFTFSFIPRMYVTD